MSDLNRIPRGESDVQIAVLGTGYVGLVSSDCMADFGQSITCVGSEPARIDARVPVTQ